jgi:hypothetical protein
MENIVVVSIAEELQCDLQALNVSLILRIEQRDHQIRLKQEGIN